MTASVSPSGGCGALAAEPERDADFQGAKVCPSQREGVRFGPHAEVWGVKRLSPSHVKRAPGD